MNPITIVQLVGAGLKLLEDLMPIVQQLGRSGDITTQAQEDMLRRFNDLKAKLDGDVTNQPHWKVEG